MVLLPVWGIDLSSDIWCDPQVLAVEAPLCPLPSWTPEQGLCLLSFSPICQTLPIFPSVKSLIPLLQNHSPLLFPLPLHPSFSRWCRHCCFLPFSSHSWLFLPCLFHGLGILYVFVLVITTSALGELVEMNLLCDKLNTNSSEKPSEVFVCVCIFIC